MPCPPSIRIALAVLLAISALPLGASAESSADFKNPNAVVYGRDKAQKLIENCWAISKELRYRGNTADTRYGALQTALCMEQVLIDQRDVLFSRHDEITREQIAKRLETLRFAYGRLYWDLFNANDACPCGTQFDSLHNFNYAELLESIIRDAIHISSDPDYGSRVDAQDKYFGRKPSAAPK